MSKELHLRYRPKTLDGVVGQPEVVKSLKEMLANNRLPHALLFAGLTGTGKTTCARILKKHLKCHDLDFMEINAADSRGIDTIRDIRSTMGLCAFGAGEGSKIYVVDEGHQLTKDASNSFLKILEDTPPHCYFIICTTDPNKLIATIRNRCTLFSFKALTPKAMRGLLTDTCAKEKIEVSEEVLDRIIEVAEGSARMGMNLLNRVINLETAEEQLSAVQKTDTRKQAFDLCKALMWGREKWPEIAKLIESIEEEPEAIRRLILATAGKSLLKGGKDANKAFLIVSAFESHFFDSGRAGLIRACWEACLGK